MAVRLFVLEERDCLLPRFAHICLELANCMFWRKKRKTITVGEENEQFAFCTKLESVEQ